ncbi:Arylsulfatase [Gimesia alba]|uniref:Arylsulfatase n=1 Tax=Gimesia alba TaxID=2527973 RepID=A0A517RA24_9PLAN|nr:sulfatase [Gimesia alba]QDT40736.1 Arylsulfatase [Gimesia alba]
MQRLAGKVFWFVLILLAVPKVVTAAPLNVVYIIVDDLGAHDLACYGNSLHQTPHIDRLANQSMKFTQAYAASPVCSPTRASLMTGKNPARLKMTVWHEQAKSQRKTKRPLIEGKSLPNLSHDETTIAERLHRAGYRTLHVGKWHLGEAGFYPESHGFDVNIGGTLWGAPQTFFYPFSGSKHYGNEFRYVPGLLERSEKDDYLTDRLTDEAIRLLKSSTEKPFFLNMAFHTVHTPIEGKPAVVQAYEKKIQPDSPWQNAEYAAMVASLDENVGRILRTLDELKLANKTAVILMSDNGGFINKYNGKTVTSNHPLRSGKGSLYEGGIRIPLLIKWPGVTTAGTVSAEPVVTSDLYPTLIDLLQLEADQGQNQRDGVSLKPLLTGSQKKLARDRLHFHYPHYYPTTTPASAIRAGNWKLIHYYEDGRNELYDLSQDPAETTDVSKQNPAQAQQLWDDLHGWLKSVDASFPQENPDRRK